MTSPPVRVLRTTYHRWKRESSLLLVTGKERTGAFGSDGARLQQRIVISR